MSQPTTSSGTAGHNLSGTALMIAHHRATSTVHPVLSKICYDPFAAHFAGAEGKAFAERQQAKSASVLPDFNVWVAVRTAYFDACVRVAADCGYDQVVLLGAGFDTRSNRLGLAHQVRFFEVDAPGPQRAKLARAEKMTQFVKSRSTYVECDFETQCFMERLSAAGFDRTLRSLFIVEGVVYYLSEAAIRSMFDKISRMTNPDTVITFDYFSKTSIENKKNAHGNKFLKEEGEPFITGINHVLPYLTKAGFSKVVHHDFDEVTLAATGTHDIKRMFRFQGIAIASNSNGSRMPIGSVIDRMPRTSTSSKL